ERIVRRWGLVLLGAAPTIGLFAAWWLSRQLGGLQRYARAVTEGERATLPRSAGEFRDLGLALETMRDRLEGKQYVEHYVHSLTHELKSPLTAIRGAAELLERPLPEADRAHFAATIREQGERMTRTIDMLLALAAVEHRQRIEDPEPVDVGALLADAHADASLRASEASVDLAIATAGALPPLPGDRFLLRQMLGNLRDHAIPVSPRRGRVAPARRGVRPGIWHPRLRGRPGVRALLLAAAPRQRRAQQWPGAGLRARGRVAPRRRGRPAQRPRRRRDRQRAPAAGVRVGRRT